SVSGVKSSLDPKLVYVFVKLGLSAKDDRFFVLLQEDLQQLIRDNHEAWLAKHGGVRPKNPKSTHTAVYLSSLADKEDNWGLIDTQMGLVRAQDGTCVDRV
ncbi:MAG: hypothetical protein AAFR93_04730, partial [Pseudomonadota bacterium]